MFKVAICLLGFATTTALETVSFESVSWQTAGCKLIGRDVLDCSFSQTGGSLHRIPTEIPTSVVHLWLNDNQISVVMAKDLEGLISLKYLYLENNNVYIIEEGAFKSLKSLVMVLLDGNKLTDLPLHLFSSTPNLQYVDLKANLLTTVTATMFFGLQNIQTLNLYDNKIRDIECGALKHVESATYFNMGGNPSSCAVDIWDARARCECDGGSDGSEGYCSNVATCSWKPPVFHNYELRTTTTTITETTATATTQTLLPAKRVIPEDINASLTQDEVINKDNGSMGSTMVGGIVGCIVVVAAVMGVAAYKKKSAFSVDRRDSDWVPTNTDSASSVSGWDGAPQIQIQTGNDVGMVDSDDAMTAVSEDSDVDGKMELNWDPSSNHHGNQNKTVERRITAESVEDVDYNSEIEQEVAALSFTTDT